MEGRETPVLVLESRVRTVLRPRGKGAVALPRSLWSRPEECEYQGRVFKATKVLKHGVQAAVTLLQHDSTGERDLLSSVV